MKKDDPNSSLPFGLRAAELFRHTFGSLLALNRLCSRPVSHICFVFVISSTGLCTEPQLLTGLDAPHLDWSTQSTNGLLEPLLLTDFRRGNRKRSCAVGQST